MGRRIAVARASSPIAKPEKAPAISLTYNARSHAFEPPSLMCERARRELAFGSTRARRIPLADAIGIAELKFADRDLPSTCAAIATAEIITVILPKLSPNGQNLMDRVVVIIANFVRLAWAPI
jgi:hypothetical protein